MEPFIKHRKKWPLCFMALVWYSRIWSSYWEGNNCIHRLKI